MNASFYFVALAMVVVVASAEELRSKKEAVYNPYTPIADAKLYSSGQNYYQSAYPYNQQYYSDYQRAGVYPYHAYQQYGYPAGQHAYPASQYGYTGQYGYPAGQYGYAGQYDPYAYRAGAYSGYQSAPSYYAPSSPLVVRQAPPYPSPGAQPIHPPVPHPFYHAPGAYDKYTTTTTEAYKPTGPK